MLGCFKLINSSKSNPPLIADHVHPEHGGLQRPGDASRGRIHALPRPPQGHHTRFVQRCLRQRGCVISASGFTQPRANLSNQLQCDCSSHRPRAPPAHPRRPGGDGLVRLRRLRRRPQDAPPLPHDDRLRPLGSGVQGHNRTLKLFTKHNNVELVA